MWVYSASLPQATQDSVTSKRDRRQVYPCVDHTCPVKRLPALNALIQVYNLSSPILRHTKLLHKKVTTLKLSFSSALCIHRRDNWGPRSQVMQSPTLTQTFSHWPCTIPTQLGNATAHSEHDKTYFEADYLTTPHSSHFHLSHLVERRFLRDCWPWRDCPEVWSPWG